MAEIGLIASVIQVAGAGLKLSQTLYEYFDTVASADRRIKDIAKEVQLTSFVINDLGHLFKHDQTSTVHTKSALKTADETVQECLSVFNDLDAALKKTQKNTLGRFTLPFRETKIELLRNHIEKLKSTLALLLLVLTHAHQLASQKLDQEAKVAQRKQIKQLFQENKQSTEKYKDSLRNYAGSDDEQDMEEEDLSSSGDPLMTTSAISSNITTINLATCVQHIQGLLDDIENLQQAISKKENNDFSEHHQSLIGSYFKARGHLDSILLGNPKTGAEIGDTSLEISSVERSELSFSIRRELTGSTLKSMESRTPEGVVMQAGVEKSQHVWLNMSEENFDSAFKAAILKAQEDGRREERERLVEEAKESEKPAVVDEKLFHTITENILKEMEKKKAEERARNAKEMERTFAEVIRKELKEARRDDERRARIEAEARAQTEVESNADREKEPIEFEDAIGRKFSFQFHLVKSWPGMRNLIAEAFSGIESMRHDVNELRYDLVGPKGRTILPSAWQIQPGWSITMRMNPGFEFEPILRRQARVKERLLDQSLTTSAGRNDQIPSSTKETNGASNDTEIDFAATVAAGLKDSGFNGNIVINDPSFSRYENVDFEQQRPGDSITSCIPRKNQELHELEQHILHIPGAIDHSLIEQPVEKPFERAEDEWDPIPKKGKKGKKSSVLIDDKPIEQPSEQQVGPDEDEWATGSKKGKGKTSQDLNPESISSEAQHNIEATPGPPENKSWSQFDADQDPGDLDGRESRSFRRKSRRDVDDLASVESSPPGYLEENNSKKDKKTRTSGLFGLFGKSTENQVDNAKNFKSRDDDEHDDRRHRKKKSRNRGSMHGSDDDDNRTTIASSNREKRRVSKDDCVDENHSFLGDQAVTATPLPESEAAFGISSRGLNALYQDPPESPLPTETTGYYDRDEIEHPTTSVEESRALQSKPTRLQPWLLEAFPDEHPLPASRPTSASSEPPKSTLPSHITEKRSYSTSIPIELRFRGAPLFPGAQSDHTFDLNQLPSLDSTPVSPAEFKDSKSEYKPMYLLERDRKPAELEEVLPALTLIGSPARATSEQVAEDEYQPALESPHLSGNGIFKDPFTNTFVDSLGVIEPELEFQHPRFKDREIEELPKSQQTTPEARPFSGGITQPHLDLSEQQLDWTSKDTKKLSFSIDQSSPQNGAEMSDLETARNCDSSPTKPSSAEDAVLGLLVGGTPAAALRHRSPSPAGYDSDFMGGDLDQETIDAAAAFAPPPATEPTTPGRSTVTRTRPSTSKKGRKGKSVDISSETPKQLTAEDRRRIRELDTAAAVDEWFADPVKEPKPIKEKKIEPPAPIAKVAPNPILLRRDNKGNSKKKGKGKGKSKKGSVSMPSESPNPTPANQPGHSSPSPSPAIESCAANDGDVEKLLQEEVEHHILQPLQKDEDKNIQSIDSEPRAQDHTKSMDYVEQPTTLVSNGGLGQVQQLLPPFEPKPSTLEPIVTADKPIDAEPPPETVAEDDWALSASSKNKKRKDSARQEIHNMDEFQPRQARDMEPGTERAIDGQPPDSQTITFLESQNPKQDENAKKGKPSSKVESKSATDNKDKEGTKQVLEIVDPVLQKHTVRTEVREYFHEEKRGREHVWGAEFVERENMEMVSKVRSSPIPDAGARSAAGENVKDEVDELLKEWTTVLG